MAVSHAIRSDQMVLTASGPRVSAMVRTFDVRATLDPDAETTTLADALARRLPGIPDQATRSAATDAVPLRQPIAIKLRHAYRAIARARFAAKLPDGATIDIGRDVLTHETVLLDFAKGQVEALPERDRVALAAHYAPLSLTRNAAGYDAHWAGTTLAFRSVRPSPVLGDVLALTDSGVTLPTHREGRDYKWIGWDAFAGKRVVLDLPHDTIWIARPAP